MKQKIILQKKIKALVLVLSLTGLALFNINFASRGNTKFQQFKKWAKAKAGISKPATASGQTEAFFASRFTKEQTDQQFAKTQNYVEKVITPKMDAIIANTKKQIYATLTALNNQVKTSYKLQSDVFVEDIQHKLDSQITNLKDYINAVIEQIQMLAPRALKEQMDREAGQWERENSQAQKRQDIEEESEELGESYYS